MSYTLGFAIELFGLFIRVKFTLNALDLRFNLRIEGEIFWGGMPPDPLVLVLACFAC